MGSAASVEINEEEAKKRNRIIDQNLRQDKLDEAKVVKLLILGASESGKSTLAKQMRIIHENGFSKLDRMEFKQQIYSNVMQSMVDIIKAMEKMQIEFGTAEMQADADRIIKYKQLVDSGDFGLTGELTGSLRRMWNDVGVRACFVRSKEFQLNDSAEYYFMDLERLSEEAYIPTEQDVLRARFQTVGVIETHFKYRGNIFRMFDVGGQRSERRKWIHFFDNVTAIIFTVATSGYDQTLKEDSTKNRLHEAIDLFHWVCSHSCFQNTSILLFLNKKDLFEAKISRSPLTICFPDYTGPNTYIDAAIFTRRKFESVARQYRKDVYPHFTNAIDTKNVEFVFHASMAVVLKMTLQESGLF